TDYHVHDRPEFIYIVSGKGICKHDGQETPGEEDVALWVPKGEGHQMINTDGVPLKLATIFVPADHASENYNRCLEAAQGQATKQERAPRHQFVDRYLGDRCQWIPIASPADAFSGFARKSCGAKSQRGTNRGQLATS